LCREAAAQYVGIGTTKFDEMVRDGRMPKPRQIDTRKVWDVHALDAAFEELPTEAERNPWDDATT
jgi:predicted DNA-binding transcriptional regulator AlpA